MKWLWTIWLCVLFTAGIAGTAEDGKKGWKTYRSEEFGYELSYPAEMKYKAYFDGSSGDLVKADTGGSLAYFEVWPPSECFVPKEERRDAVAREVGIQRAKDITQADGHGTSSHCDDPMTIRDVSSLHGTRIYELELTCVSEEYPGANDDEADNGKDDVAIDANPIIANIGKKGPTYFVDISQPWLKRVLMVDPVGVDPRQYEKKDTTASEVLRKILPTLKTFPVPKRTGTCIQDLSTHTH